MADVQPLRALHYDPSVVGPLADVVAPPYDVIDAEQRAALLARSPYNVVARRPARRASPDPYAAARELFESWQLQGAVVRDREPALWAHTQDYTGPDGTTRTRRGLLLPGAHRGLRPGPGAPARAHAPGPEGGPPAPDARDAREHLADLLALLRPRAGGVERARAGHRSSRRGARSPTRDGTVHRLWRVADPEAIAAVQAATRDAELLIADGHHRYETMQAYAEEVGGEGEHRYILMCLVALEDPGLTVFPTHRLVNGLDAERQEALAAGAASATSRSPRCPLEQIAPAARRRGRCSSATSTPTTSRALRLTLKDQAIADAALPGHSEAYRRLDTGRAGGAAAEGSARAERRGHLALQRPVLRARHRGGARDGALGRVRRRVPDAPHAGRAGARRGGRAARTCRRSRRSSSPSCSRACCSTPCSCRAPARRTHAMGVHG